MPLTRVAYPYPNTLRIPSLLSETNTVSGNSLFQGTSTFVGNASFSSPITSTIINSTAENTTDLSVTNFASIGTVSQLAQLTIIPTIASRRAVQIRGAVGQTADYLRIENSATTQLLTVASDGAVTFVGDVLHNLNNGRFNNISSLWFNSPNTMGVGAKYGRFPVLFIESTNNYAPVLIRGNSSNPHRNDSIEIIANDASNTPIFQISPTGEISSRSSNRVPLNVRGVRNTGVFQTNINTISGNGSTVTYSTGSNLGNVIEVGSTATITGATTSAFNGTFLVTSADHSSFQVASTAIGTSSTATATSVGHTVDLVRYTDSANTVVGGINALAQPYTGSTTTINTQVGGAVTAGSHDGTTATLNLTSASNLAVGDQIVVSGFTPAGYNGRHIITAVSNVATFSVSYRVPNPGATSVLGIVSAPAQSSIFARSSGTIGQVIRGSASQVADLQQWQTSVPVTVTSISPAGVVTASSFIPTSSTVPTNGMYLSAANTLNFATNSTDRLSINSTGLVTIPGALTVTGDLTVNGTTTAINSVILSVDDKNIEMGAVAAVTVSTTGTVGSITGTGPWTATITGMTDTADLIVGSAITATNGTGSLGAGGTYIVASIVSATSITYTATGGTTPVAGTVTNITTTGATDTTANGGGIILKGATDKSILWDSTNSNWTSTEHLNLATGKVFKINNSTLLTSTALTIDTIAATAVGSTAALWSTITTGSIAIGAGLTTGALNIATVGTGATPISIGHTNATLAITTSGTTLTTAGALTLASTIQATTATLTGATLSINGASPTISSTNASAASIFTGTVTGVSIGSSTIKTTAYPADGTTSTAASGEGYMGMPQVSTGVSRSFAATDAGKHVYVTATGTTQTIPANSTVAFPIGTTIVVVNGNSVSTSIAITTDTLRLANSTSTGTRTLASNGMCTLLKINTTEWIASGNGLT